jgi:FtsH-binding integral membrane protein
MRYFKYLRRGLVWALGTCAIFFLLDIFWSKNPFEWWYVLIGAVVFVFVGAPLMGMLVAKKTEKK